MKGFNKTFAGTLGLVFQIPLLLAGSGAAGYFLDKYLATFPLFFIVLTAAGFLSAIKIFMVIKEKVIDKERSNGQ